MHLDPSSKKYICPKCGQRRFVIYLDNEGNKIDDSCGRCDRQDNCGYHYPPREYFRDRRRQGLATEPYTPRPRIIEAHAPTAPSFINPRRLLDSTAIPYTRNTLFQAIARLTQGFFTREVLTDTFDRYLVGTAPNGAAEFFQIDAQMRPRTGKVMGYDPTGHRNGNITWVHKEKEYADSNFDLRQCFFGTMLAQQNPKAVIWLFESEKTALVVSALLQRGGAEKVFVPMACGGCSGISAKPEHQRDPWHAISILRNREVVLFPDNGKYREWKQVAERLQGFCSKVYVASGLEPAIHPWEDLPFRIVKGCDYADVIFDELREGRDPTPVMMHSYR